MFSQMDDDEVRFFNGIMPYTVWLDIEYAARYANKGDKQMAEVYRRAAGYSEADIRRDSR